MSSNAILAWKDGWLCVRETDTRFTEPIQDTWYWPLQPCTATEYQDLYADVPLYTCGPACYATHLNGGVMYFVLPEGIHTKALAVESVPVRPPPRIRRPLRWQHGAWYKHESRKGWVRC